MRFIIVYKPPSPEFTQLSNELTDLITEIDLSNTIILGDFNNHYGSSTSPHYNFFELLDSLSLKQHVHFPTHSSGYTIDLILTSYSSAFSDLSINRRSLTLLY